MDETTYKATVERLQEVNGVIEGLDQAIRADAFRLLHGYVVGSNDALDDLEDESTGPEDRPGKPKSVQGKADFDALIEEHESHKDSDNALLTIAIVYARHGKGPFPMSVIKAVADEFNLTIPNRPDMFLKGHKREGKEVLRKQADGWKVTPSGETWLKATYGVSRGKKALPSATES